MGGGRGRIEAGQSGSLEGGGEDESRGSLCVWGGVPVNHSMMDHDVSG